MVILKISVAALFILGFISFWIAGSAGASMGKSKDGLRKHKFWVNMTVGLVLVAVLVTEIMVRMNGGVQNGLLLYIHLSFALPLLVSLLTLRFYLTGLKNLIRHMRLAHFSGVLFIGTLFTGGVLLISL